ncbi:WD_0736 family protein [Wolbachia endosymbiont of Trichogramma kaykai]|uniref:WD_0736 family protein n=1 Tax=Wolbachia endosymbiont of Trichogramma kaykai TaxID=444066 RepID=UPI003891B8D0
MIKNKEKHQMAFCVSAFTLLAGLSLIATGIAAATVPAIASCLVTGGILTALSIMQSVESYLFLQNSEKIFNKMIGGIRDEPERKIFIERILQPFIGLFSEYKQHN